MPKIDTSEFTTRELVEKLLDQHEEILLTLERVEKTQEDLVEAVGNINYADDGYHEE